MAGVIALRLTVRPSKSLVFPLAHIATILLHIILLKL